MARPQPPTQPAALANNANAGAIATWSHTHKQYDLYCEAERSFHAVILSTLNEAQRNALGHGNAAGNISLSSLQLMNALYAIYGLSSAEDHTDLLAALRTPCDTPSAILEFTSQHREFAQELIRMGQPRAPLSLLADYEHCLQHIPAFLSLITIFYASNTVANQTVEKLGQFLHSQLPHIDTLKASSYSSSASASTATPTPTPTPSGRPKPSRPPGYCHYHGTNGHPGHQCRVMQDTTRFSKAQRDATSPSSTTPPGKSTPQSKPRP
jgi:hypothetical protein